MPQQLIYTSAPRGIVAGRSGYCTVARSALMREALMLQLEKFCYYQHLSLAGGRERPIFACRIVDIRGTRFHVLSRIQDAGLDFTGRTNFIAHHLVFTPEEIRQFPAPPIILGHWPGWLASWTKEPQLLENETWTELVALNDRVTVPAQTWQQVTGDAANGYGLLEARAGAAFRVDDLTDATVLDLLAESLTLLEVRDPRRDCRTAAWSYTFTTSMQEQDNPADFRWRCLHVDNPVANRFVTPDCRPLSAVRAIKCTGEEIAFAGNGRLAPGFTVEPQDLQIVKGETARFMAKAGGVPSPAYQWFLVDRAEKRQPLAGETNSELVIANPPMGVSRYVVRAANSMGDVASRVAKLSVDERAKVALSGGSLRTAKTAIHQKSEEDIERQRQRIAVLEEENSRSRPGIGLWVIVLILLSAVLVAGLCVYVQKKNEKPVAIAPMTNAASQASSAPAVSSGSANAPLSLLSTPVTNAAKAGGIVLRSQAPIPLPAPWTGENIGSSATSKTSRYYHGAYLLPVVAGDLSPGKTNDNFYFTRETCSNSVLFFARFPLVGTTDKTICGIMLRGSDRADAPFVFIGSLDSNIVWMQRSADGAPSTEINCLTTTEPIYLQLVYRKPNFFGNFSNDGIHWSPAGPKAQIDFDGPDCLLGFAVCSSRDGKNADMVCDHVTVQTIEQ